MDRSLYTRPNKPRTLVVQNRGGVPPVAPLVTPSFVTVDAATECHVTPPPVAAKMVEYLCLKNGLTVLEPQGGTGNLAAAVLESGCTFSKFVTVERHNSLCDTMRKRFGGEPLTLVQSCFLSYSFSQRDSIRFSRVLMNPPFRHVKKHMDAALSLLADEDAILVALVPVTYDHPEAELCEVLDRGTFCTANVMTKIIKISR